MKIFTLVVVAHLVVLVGLAGLSRAQEACSPACDLDKSGGSRMTAADYAVFLAAFNTRKGDPKYNPEVDFDNSGTVTAADFALLLKFCPLK